MTFEIDHFGALMYYCIDDDPAVADALARPYIPPGRANAETLALCTAFGPPALVRERLEAYVEAGGSKFVLRPMCPPERMLEQLARLADGRRPGLPPPPLTVATAQARLDIVRFSVYPSAVGRGRSAWIGVVLRSVLATESHCLTP